MIRQAPLITVQKTLAVEESPEQILGPRWLARRLRGTSGRLSASALVGKRESVARYKLFHDGGFAFARRARLFVTRPFGSATASEMVLAIDQVERLRRLRSARRSHSHADSRVGRPNRSRKPSLPTCGSGNLRCIRVLGNFGEHRPGSGRARHPIHQLLGCQTPRDRVREVIGVILIPFVRQEARLVGAAVHDGSHHVLEIEIVVRQIFRERIEQRRIDGRIGGADIIDGIDDSLSEEVAPHAIRNGFGKERDSLLIPANRPTRHGGADRMES